MKELHTGQLYWPTTRRDSKPSSPLQEATAAKVAIIGGGMSGVNCAYAFAKAGLDTLLVERGEIAGGSTSANTGMLQFCNDIMLCDLIDQIGKADAQLFYKRCLQSVDELEQTALSLPVDVGFKRRSSLYFASSEQDLPKLKREYEALKETGFQVEWWSADDISARFPFRKPGAIVTHGDAEVNPYQFVLALADGAAQAGARLYEHTDIERHEKLADGRHRLYTSGGLTIDADYLVCAVGYEPEELRGKLVQASMNRSYSIATSVIPEPLLPQWHEQWLIWETARPYLYMRTTVDGRVIAGGLDEEIEQPVHRAAILDKRGEKLLERVHSLFPDWPLAIEYTWNATFGESQDNLPFIGEDPALPGVYYNLGYGGNGTVYSMIGAKTILGLIRGEYKVHPLPFIGIRTSTT
ncbi:NAD(P)/FAD-dependent oxidoreductase [Paenibacillus paeoniae]|uniref:FAD-binding oxidoreductase n=1 Tax=Paenibacillus paeoniae TaxID=2292705 RepID=A0A371P6F5_9BACL|nr:FAD-dependent oxidoreductase [Paenibacillus paeoniae]REK71455.1 FAD-binding oxidoreductase [Paenibacillus paeoniae]